MRALRSVAPVAVILLLAGCAGAPPPGGSPSSVAAGGESARTYSGSVGDGAPHEAENTRYRDRVPVAAGSPPALTAARSRVLDGLAASPDDPTEARVRAVLVSAGAADGGAWVARDAATGQVDFEAQVDQAGCLVGRVPATGDPVVDPAGFVMDGGCHALTGH